MTTTWSRLLRERLDLTLLEPGDDPVPFGLPPVPGEQWTAHELVERNGIHVLGAHTASGLEAVVSFRFFSDTRAVECWGEIVNRGSTTVVGVSQSLVLDTALRFRRGFERPWIRTINGADFSAYFPPTDFGVVDRQILDLGLHPVTPASISLSSAPNGRTSWQHLPCAILGNEAGTTGLAFMLEWAGLWRMGFGPARTSPPPLLWDSGDRTLVAGIQVEIGVWGLDLDLGPGQSLPLPRLLIAAYDGDLDAGGNALRRHIRRHVTPKLAGAEPLPPTSFNSWFAFGTDVSAERLRLGVPAAGAAGLEYFVIDNGWFEVGTSGGGGNWDAVDEVKFPGGIAPFADHVRAHGMKYGTWFEPEWVHVDSDLHRRHPDWFWPTPPPERPWEPTMNSVFRSHGYAMLDFGRREAQDWWIARIGRAYDEWGVRWIRWDFNHAPRPNWEDGVPAGQVGWRQIEHVRGLYRVWDEILAAFPDLFIEQCASGGHRIELGTVRRGHSFWMNDVTRQSDLVRAFQHGLNTVLPGNYPNTNLCQPRHDFTDYDFLSHGAGGFGYSGRLWEAPKADFERYAAAIARFKDYRHLLLGEYSRPTGQPRRADEYARVSFVDAGESVSLDFNAGGAGTARLERG